MTPVLRVNGSLYRWNPSGLIWRGEDPDVIGWLMDSMEDMQNVYAADYWTELKEVITHRGKQELWVLSFVRWPRATHHVRGRVY